jgi:hypothetical protein
VFLTAQAFPEAPQVGPGASNPGPSSQCVSATSPSLGARTRLENICGR